MLYNPELRIPFGYGQEYKRLGDVVAWLLLHHHPEYVRRLARWLTYKNGEVGIGGGWRATGSQPTKPGFAPEGKSFHQNQRYADGFFGAGAVDLVSRDGPDANFSHDGVTWAMVPRQGSAEARKWGVHCNIDSEAWHMQAVEIDGYDSWVKAGRTAPARTYSIPALQEPIPAPQPRPAEPAPQPPLPPALPEFSPEQGIYGLWPLNPDKRWLWEGAQGDDVRYLQAVLKRVVGDGTGHGGLAAGFFSQRADDNAVGPDRDTGMYLVAAKNSCNDIVIDGNFGAVTRRALEFVGYAFDWTGYNNQHIGPCNFKDGRCGEGVGNGWDFIDAISDGAWY